MRVEDKGIGTVVVIVIAVMIAVVAVIGGYYLGTHSGGSSGGSGGGGEVSVSDILLHPAQYMGKQVVVRGTVLSTPALLPNSGMLTNGDSIYLINLPDSVSIGATYLVTGVVTNSTEGFMGDIIAISVTDIRLAD
jgi:hypothetical protein